MINVFGSDLGEAEVKAAKECMDSQWVGFGKIVGQFEARFSERLGLDHFLMVDSGSNALYMACYLLDLKPGDEIIVPSFTWVSCAQAVLMCGLKPVFADVDVNTMNVNSETISKSITPRTKAIMIVHYAGLPCDMDPILQLGFPVIEDAAHAVDAYYKGKACGSIGDIGIYSFDAVKNLTAIEGGGITTKCPIMAKRASQLRYCGIGKSGFDAASDDHNDAWWEYTIQEPFIKMLPTNLHAAVAIEQLKRLDQLQTKRLEMWNLYTEELKDLADVIIPRNAAAGDRHGLFTYCIRCTNRNQLAHYLLSNDIYTTVRYHPLHLNDIYLQSSNTLEGSELLNQTALSLPLHPRLTMSDVLYVTSKIKEFYKVSR